MEKQSDVLHVLDAPRALRSPAHLLSANLPAPLRAVLDAFSFTTEISPIETVEVQFNSPTLRFIGVTAVAFLIGILANARLLLTHDVADIWLLSTVFPCALSWAIVSLDDLALLAKRFSCTMAVSFMWLVLGELLAQNEAIAFIGLFVVANIFVGSAITGTALVILLLVKDFLTRPKIK